MQQLRRAGLVHDLGRVHERLDGSGYHRGVGGPMLPRAARILAAADVYQALGEERPFRPVFAAAQATRELRAAVAAGALGGDAAGAVLVAAGQRPARLRRAWPRGLTDREIEVLRLVARGRTAREIAAELVVSRPTANHHIEHIYAKIGVSSRAGAALFAVEHDLLDP